MDRNYNVNQVFDIFARTNRPKRFHLFFILTHRCNLNCTYCFEENCNRKNTEADEEFIKSTIGKYLDNLLIGECEITFFGGEPLLLLNVYVNGHGQENGKTTMSFLRTLMELY